MWKQSYNACPTVLYSIDIGSVSVFTVQIDDTSENMAILLTQTMGQHFSKVGATVKQKSQGAQAPRLPGSDIYVQCCQMR